MKKYLCYGGVVLAVILAVISYQMLPDPVVVQIARSGNPSTSPKWIVLVFPVVLTVVGAYIAMKNNEIELTAKGAILEVVGVIAYIFMLCVNCL